MAMLTGRPQAKGSWKATLHAHPEHSGGRCARNPDDPTGYQECVLPVQLFNCGDVGSLPLSPLGQTLGQDVPTGRMLEA